MCKWILFCLAAAAFAVRGEPPTRASPGHTATFDVKRVPNECWRRVGVEVLPVRADRVIPEGGAVRCLSNAFRQD